MYDPQQALRRAAEQMKKLEEVLGSGGLPSANQLFDPDLWQAMAAGVSPKGAKPKGAEPKEASPQPPVDLVLTDLQLIIIVTLPGIEQPDQIRLALAGERRLRLSGHLPAHPLTKQGKLVKNERLTGAFSRVIELPVPVRAETARCTYEAGILEISLQRADEPEQEQPLFVNFSREGSHPWPKTTSKS